MVNNGNLLDLPVEILMKIIKLAENDKNLSLTCFKFYELIKRINEKNVSLSVDYRYLLNPSLDLENFLNSSSTISLYINDNCSNLKNFDEKLQSFLQIYGHKVTKLIFNSRIKIHASKFLHLLPNLEELQLMKPISFEISEFQKFPKTLKNLKIHHENDLKNLEIFDVKELEINNDYYNNLQQNVDFIRNNRNLEKLTICYFTDINLSSAINLLNLKTLKIVGCQWTNQEMFGNCLKNLTQLKELTINAIPIEIFTIICDHLKQLEKLDFYFFSLTFLSDLKKVSKLSKLKELSIRNHLEENHFDELTKIKLKFLESLNISINFNSYLTQRIENLSENFLNLKSLTLFFIWQIPVKVLTKIFESFDKLENLSLSFVDNIQFNDAEENFFYLYYHKNENLKSLHFDRKNFQIEKLILNFILAFPNLEVFEIFGIFEVTREILKILLLGFPKLKKIQNLEISEDLLEFFLRFNKNFEEFNVYVNMLDDPNERLKDCSFSIHGMECFNKINRKEEIEIELSLSIYAHWQKIQTMMTSTKDIKKISICSLKHWNINDQILINCLRNISESVTKLSFFYDFSLTQIESLMKIFPNCEFISFDLNYFLRDLNSYFIFIENLKVHSVCVNLDFNYDLNFTKNKLNDFLEKIKFSKNSLKNFKCIIRNTDKIKDECILEMLEKRLGNQEKLVKKFENYNEEKRKFVYEFRA
ncbi:hypothetical protein PVAND_017254 [Polypedilum vanderplanki]|uniref:F-box domain-containing protein n=1 Tax=Polypedilum vanderplanki TaxID=319348 RepID=A0A9J6BII2_POLVA|nr:hypothetical protein PVAND_017254 [Polypedilum vanderplanki]